MRNWDIYFMYMAKLAALRSTCRSRPVGAVIVKDNHILTTGYNGAISGQLHCTDYGCNRRVMGIPDSDKQSYCTSIHAEANAIAQAAKLGIPIKGSVVYTTLAPCYNCFKLLHNSGIYKIIYEHKYESPNNKRDTFWENRIKSSGISFVKLDIPEDIREDISEELKLITSKRKLDV